MGSSAWAVWVALTLVLGADTAKGQGCEPIQYGRCSSILPYSHTRFPNPLGLPDQQFALAAAPAVFTALDMVTKCPHLDFLLCGLMFPECTPEGIRYVVVVLLLLDMVTKCPNLDFLLCGLMFPECTPEGIRYVVVLLLLLDMVTKCPHLDFLLCGLMFPECTPEGVRMPCRPVCQYVIETCAGPVLRAMEWLKDIDEWLTLFCDALPERNCVHPAPCEPVRVGMCHHAIPYNITAFPNLLGQKTQAELLADSRTMNVTSQLMHSGCHPHIHFAVCSAMVPNCADSLRIPPCKSFCRDVRSHCEATFKRIGDPWPFDCESLPDVHEGKCSAPYNNLNKTEPRKKHNNTECEPIKFDRCSGRLPYSWAKFPSTLGIPDQGLALAVAPVVFTAMDLLKLSACSPHLETVLCSLLFQDCKSDQVRLPCRSLCHEIITSCAGPVLSMAGMNWAPVGPMLPSVSAVCNVLPDTGCIGPDNKKKPDNTSNCEPLKFDRCRGRPYNHTSFPNFFGLPDQETALAVAPAVFAGLDLLMMTGCHPQLDVFFCALSFPGCTPEGRKLPCRSFCEQIMFTCGAPLLAAMDMEWLAFSCYLLPEDNCVAAAPGSPTNAASSIDMMIMAALYNNTKCEPVPYERCASVPYSKTRFINDIDRELSKQIPNIFGMLDVFMLSGCHPHLDLFVCSMVFPQCAPVGVRLPCRAFCQEVLSSCVGPAVSQSDLQWIMYGCYVFPERDCIAPAHNQTARSNSRIAPRNSTECHPLQYRRCSARIPNTRFPNVLMHPNQDFAIGSANGIFSLLDMLRLSQCHPHLDAVVCSVFFPTCKPEGTMLPCRSLCEEIIMSCGGPVLGMLDQGNTSLAWALPWVASACMALPEEKCIGPAWNSSIVPSADAMIMAMLYDNTKCEPVPYERCSAYPQTRFINEIDRQLSTPLVPNIFGMLDVFMMSGCHPQLDLFVCSMVFPQCAPVGVRLPCRSFCQEVLFTCVGPSVNETDLQWLMLGCYAFPVRDCVKPAPHHQMARSNRTTPANSSDCQPLRYRRCSARIPNTKFPNLLMHPNQDFAIGSANGIFSLLDMLGLSQCHPHLDAVVCSVFFPSCKPEGMMLPCRSLCEEIIFSCGSPVLGMLGNTSLTWALPWVASACMVLPEEKCIGPAWNSSAVPSADALIMASLYNNTKCEHVPYERCSAYPQTRFINEIDRQLSITLVPNIFGMLELFMMSGCHPHLDLFVCSMVFPQCAPVGVRLPCRSFCQEIVATCVGPAIKEDDLQWVMLGCFAFPERDCVKPDGHYQMSRSNMTTPTNSSECQPLRYGRCSARIPNARFPNLLMHPNQDFAIGSANGIFSLLDMLGLSWCHPHLEAVVCSVFFPSCKPEGMMLPCRSLCEEIIFSCGGPVLGMLGLGSSTWALPWVASACTALPEEKCIGPALNSSTVPSADALIMAGLYNNTKCEHVPYDRCTSYPQTRFINEIDRQLSTALVPKIFGMLDVFMLSGCHPQLDLFVCSMTFPQCAPVGVRLPCRSFCQEIVATCVGPAVNETDLQWLMLGCYAFPERDCVKPDVHHQMARSNMTTATNSSECQPLRYRRCSARIPKTRFPNVLMEPNQDFAIGSANGIFNLLDMLRLSQCHPHLEAVVCSVLFPSCEPAGSMLPCRSLCEEIIMSCGGPVLYLLSLHNTSFAGALPWTTAVCAALPEQKCIGPAFQHNSASVFDMMIMAALYDNTTCEHVPYERCSAYPQTRFINDIDRQLSTALVPNIFGMLDVFMLSGCHPHLDLFVCSMAMPQCAPVGVRMPCRSFCQEVLYTCVGPMVNQTDLEWMMLGCYAFPVHNCVKPDLFNQTVQNNMRRPRNSSECHPLQYGRCSARIPNTRFPNMLMQPNQDFAIASANEILNLLEMFGLSQCHPHLDAVVCSVFFPTCEPAGTMLPCRSLCEEIMMSCGGHVLRLLDLHNSSFAEALPWLASACMVLPEKNCIGPAFNHNAPSSEMLIMTSLYNNTKCEPVPYERCASVPYSKTRFINDWDRQLSTSLVPNIFGMLDVFMMSGCHPHLDLFVCSMVFPQCAPVGVRLPCRSFCQEILATCVGRTVSPSDLQWLMIGCYTFPERNCIAPSHYNYTAKSNMTTPRNSSECHPLQYRRCSARIPNTRFPNLLMQPNQDFAIGSANGIFSLFDMLVPSQCHPHLEAVVCSLFFPTCEADGSMLPCRSLCEEVVTSCGSQMLGLVGLGETLGAALPWLTMACMALPDNNCIGPAFQCEPIKYDRCSARLSYPTRFPNAFGLPNQDMAMVVAPGVFTALDFLSKCHADLEFFTCSLFYQECTPKGFRLPCRSLCREVVGTCGKQSGMEWLVIMCDVLPEDNCIAGARVGRCGKNEVECWTPGRNLTCIDKSLVCDGKWDCPSGSDELRCAPKGSCNAWEFQCESHGPPVMKNLDYKQNSSMMGGHFPRNNSWNSSMMGGHSYSNNSWMMGGHLHPNMTNSSVASHVSESHEGSPEHTNMQPKCIDRWQLCDGRPDCPSAEDESFKHCVGRCEPVRSEYGICSHVNSTTFPNLVGNANQHELINSRETLKLMNSSCYPNMRSFVCSSVTPRCEDNRMIPICRGLCLDVLQHCAPLYRQLGIPVDCTMYPDERDSTPCISMEGSRCGKAHMRCRSPEGSISCVHENKICNGKRDCPYGDDEQDCECQPIRFARCSALLPYSRTDFPNILALPSQDFAVLGASAAFTMLEFLPKCHPHMDNFICSLFFSECRHGDLRLPCRSVCQDVITSCGKPLLGEAVHLATLLCNALPKHDCIGQEANCTKGRMPCWDMDGGYTCVNSSLKCDGKEDCPFGQDELHCEKTCGNREMECWTPGRSISCVDRSLVCNGNWDCPFGDDERNCDSRPCAPFPEELGFCAHISGYSHVSFPNVFGHGNFETAVASEEYRALMRMVPWITSSCYPNIYAASCLLFFPRCENGTKVLPCRSVCEEIQSSCLPAGIKLPLACDKFPRKEEDHTCSQRVPGTPSGCKPVEFGQCAALGYETKFPHPLLPFSSQEEAYAQLKPYLQLSSCHPYLEEYMCLFYFPKCTRREQRLPCRSYCYEVSEACSDAAVNLGLQLNSWQCDLLKLPEENCITSPFANVKECSPRQTTCKRNWNETHAVSDPVCLEPAQICDGSRDCPLGEDEDNCYCELPGNNQDFSSGSPGKQQLSQGSSCDSCQPITLPLCLDMPWQNTRFPNFFGHPGQPTIQADRDSVLILSMLANSKCHEHVHFAVCAVATPKCESGRRVAPCRKFCKEIQASCEHVLTSVNQPWPFDCDGMPPPGGDVPCITPSQLVDVDECATGQARCDRNADCRNLFGSYTCNCSQGYESTVANGTGFPGECKDIDECKAMKPVCGPHSRCHNIPGGFKCRCDAGYEKINATHCSDVDECSSGLSGCSDLCNNTDGGFFCRCPQYFELDTQNNKTCKPALSCENSSPCSPGDVSTCAVTGSGYQCGCQAGYQLAPNSNTLCININECRTGANNCHRRLGICTDTRGGFSCSCRPGYTGAGTVGECEDVDECATGQYRCDDNADCVNQVGSYTCQCRTGYRSIGRAGTGFPGECKEIRLFPYGAGSEHYPLVSRGGKVAVSALIPVPNGLPVRGGQLGNSIYVLEDGVLVVTSLTSGRDGAPKKIFRHPTIDRGAFDGPLVAVLAPFWADSIMGRRYPSKVWYFPYTPGTPNYDKVFSMAAENVQKHFGVENFRPTFVLIVTWENMAMAGDKPRDNIETNTFQAALVTDNIHTYLGTYYADGGMRWDPQITPGNLVGGKWPAFVGMITKDPSGRIQVAEAEGSRTKTMFPNGTKDCSGPNVYCMAQKVSPTTNRTGIRVVQVDDNPPDWVNPRLWCADWFKREPNPSTFARMMPCPLTLAHANLDLRFRHVSKDNKRDCFEQRDNSGFSDGGNSVCCYRRSGPFIWNLARSGNMHRYAANTQEYQNSDVLPREHCCQETGSSYCQMYFRKRPRQHTAGYEPPRISAGAGDPHITTFDGLSYSFNGLGEYLMANTTGSAPLSLLMQGRTALADVEPGKTPLATVFSGIAVKQGSASVQLYLDSTGSSLDVYVDSTQVALADIASGTDSLFRDGELQLVTDSSSGNVTGVKVIFNSGISVQVDAGLNMLTYAVSMTPDMKGHVRGMLGNFNSDSTDEFYWPNGTAVAISNVTNPAEAETFPWGQTWALPNYAAAELGVDPSTISLFSVYPGGKNAATYGNLTFQPLFFDLDTMFATEADKNRAIQVCGSADAKECLFDIALTGKEEVGAAAAAALEAVASSNKALDNTPPVFNVTSEIRATVGQEFGLQLEATDDGTVTISLQDGSPGSINATDYYTWTPPDTSNVTIEFLATDDAGASTLASPDVTLCSCQNNGTCNWDTLLADRSNGFAVASCDCQPGFEGDHCETDTDGCLVTPCYPGVNCTDAPAPLSADTAEYTCGACPTGMVGDGQSCADLNECLLLPNDTDVHQCKNATCHNEAPGYSCECLTGYMMLDDNTTCVDIDECSAGTDNCDAQATCTNTESSFNCTCNTGYTGDGTTCTDIDECQTGNGGCDRNCLDLEGSYECSCDDGFRLADDKHACEDINECAGPNHGCTQVCSNTVGGYECSCGDYYTLASDGKSCEASQYCRNDTACTQLCAVINATEVCSCLSGYALAADNKTCTDNNECAANSTNSCDPNNGICTNIPGSYNCSCQTGTQLENNGGTLCEDIDACLANPCDAQATCTDNPAPALDATCACNSGYTGDGLTSGTGCSDINACLANPCHAQATCTDKPPPALDATCACNSGYTGDGLVSGSGCSDVNACLANPCHAQATCTDKPPPALDATCACNAGYTGDGLASGTGCSDINACSTNPCHAQATCTDNPAPALDATCTCNAGYTGDGLTSGSGCSEINACLANPCHAQATCTDNPAPALDATCACNAGYTGDGLDSGSGCSDTNACLANPCHAQATCADKPAPALDATCTCNAGYTGDGLASGSGCSDTNACSTNPCHAQATCADKPPPALDATCTCNAGYTGDGLVSGSGCSDLNACSTNPCHAQATCTDKPAPALDATCTCNAGYTGDGLASGSGCSDINACSTNPCHAQATCTDNPAPALDATCTCNSGYTGDGLASGSGCSVSCPSGFDNHWGFGKCLYVHKQPLRYNAAKSFCQNKGGKLFLLDNSADVTRLKQLMTAYRTKTGRKRGVWIGLTDSATEGTFVWEGGAALGAYTDWAPGALAANTPSRDCVQMKVKYGWKWTVSRCTGKNAFICEAP